ncbi:MAG: hypothetical protein IT445_01520 [Phycisphaeraceae bacterium]|nr:hypothetical protein [Phycisphaeraceae bacterium]
MTRKRPEKKQPPATRGKYAEAFKSGVNVVVHTSEGDKTHHVRRNPDGSFDWDNHKADSSAA